MDADSGDRTTVRPRIQGWSLCRLARNVNGRRCIRAQGRRGRVTEATRMNIVYRMLGAVLLTVAGMAPAYAMTAQSGVAELLAQSASAWNRGDLDAFMKTYEDSPQTQYVSSTKIVHGYAAIRARYAGHYQPGHMGTLSISDLAVRPLGADYAVATARWHLARPAAKGGNVSGLFSLVLHRNSEGWHIITDHTP